MKTFSCRSTSEKYLYTNLISFGKLWSILNFFLKNYISDWFRPFACIFLTDIHHLKRKTYALFSLYHFSCKSEKTRKQEQNAKQNKSQHSSTLLTILLWLLLQFSNAQQTYLLYYCCHGATLCFCCWCSY